MRTETFSHLQFHDHDFRRLNERSRGLSDFQTHLAHRVGGNNRRDLLPANGEPDLRHQPFDADFGHAAYQLVATADAAEALPPFWSRLDTLAVEKPVEFGAGYPMVSSCGFYTAKLAVIDPLFQGGIAHTQHAGGFAHGHQVALHEQRFYAV